MVTAPTIATKLKLGTDYVIVDINQADDISVPVGGASILTMIASNWTWTCHTHSRSPLQGGKFQLNCSVAR